MKILLINPPSPFLLDDRVFLTLGILQVATVLEEAGHDVKVEDLGGQDNYVEITGKRASEGWDCYGVTATTPQFPAAVAILQAIRGYDPGKRVIIGGPHATVMPESCGMFDCIVQGDGEEAILDAIQPDAPKRLDRASTTTKGMLKWHWPARHLVDMSSYDYKLFGRKGTNILTEMGCPYSSPDGDTFVALPEGLVKPNELALTSVDVCGEGHAHALATEGTVKFASHSEAEECVRIRLRHGFELVLTPDHKIRCAVDGKLAWKEAGKLCKGDVVALIGGQNRITDYVKLVPPDLSMRNQPRVPVRVPPFLDEDLAWVIGFFLGNGSYLTGETCGVSFSVNRHHVERQRKPLLEFLRSVFHVEPHIYALSNTLEAYRVDVASVVIYEFFNQSLKIDGTNKLRIPPSICRSSSRVVDSFLSGLWAADGYWPKRRDSYLTTAKRKFAQDVSVLGLWAGIPLHVRRGSISELSGKRAWRVVRCTHECLKKVRGPQCWIGRIPTHRPHRSRNGRVYRARNVSWVSRRHLSSLLPEDVLLAYWYSPVTEVAVVGRRRVWSIANHPSHEYTAAGVVIANCSFCCGRGSKYFRLVRYRPVDDIIRELYFLQDAYGITAAMDFSDEINLMNEPLLEFCEKLRPLKMKFRAFIKANLFNDRQAEAMANAGFVELCTGCESGSDRILGVIEKQTTREINKRFVDLCHKHGIKAKAFMSLAQAGETYESAMESKDWLSWARPDDFDMTIVTVYPGTPYWDKRKRVGLNESGQPVCRYTKQSRNPNENGATLFFEEVNYAGEWAYYKGVPGQYVSHVWTPDLSKEDLVLLRDQIEADVRKELAIPYPKRYSGDQYEHSMGQGTSPQDSRVALKEST